MAAGPHRVKNYLSEQHFPRLWARGKQSEPARHGRAAGKTVGSPLPDTHLHITASLRREPVPVCTNHGRKSLPRLNRIIETALYVDDLERASDFYETKLGLAPLLKTATLFAYDVGGQNVLLLFLRGKSLLTQSSAGGSIPPHDGSGPLHIAFAIDTDELPGWEAKLDQLGITVEGRMQWERGSTSLYFRDPDGHLLELATPGLWRSY